MGLPSAETLEHPSAPASSNDAMEEDAACSEAGNESGPGELAEAPTHEEAAQSRRSSLSLREKTLCALEEARFPAYPAVSAKEVDFALPDGFIDNDAPLSARKWCALASLISAQPRLQVCVRARGITHSQMLKLWLSHYGFSQPLLPDRPHRRVIRPQVCVCVCVCVREREREREGGRVLC